MEKTGSRGAGINLSFGALSEVEVKESDIQIFDFFVNNNNCDSPVVQLALNHLIGSQPLHITVRTNLDLPIGQGFGMSAASAVSASYALAYLLGISNHVAMKAAHFAEIQLKTGLGDVIASCFGGIEIRKEAGLPPWGMIEHIPGSIDLVLCVIGDKLDTCKILSDREKIVNISQYGKYCIKKLLDNPTIENLFSISQLFTKKTRLAESRVNEAINIAKNYGAGSMCMLGNSLFASGETDKLSKVLSNFGKVYVCKVDQFGAHVIKND
jgi:pantoate kinase